MMSVSTAFDQNATATARTKLKNDSSGLTNLKASASNDFKPGSLLKLNLHPPVVGKSIDLNGLNPASTRRPEHNQERRKSAF